MVLSCLSPLEEAGLLVVFGGIPVLAGTAVSTLVVAALLARRAVSPVVTGSVLALCSAVAVAVAGRGLL